METEYVIASLLLLIGLGAYLAAMWELYKIMTRRD